MRPAASAVALRGPPAREAIMEMDEDREPVPDIETLEFYRVGPPTPSLSRNSGDRSVSGSSAERSILHRPAERSILRKPGDRPRRNLPSRRVSFSKDVIDGSSESLPNRTRSPPSGRTLRKKQSISIIAFCSFAMVTLVGVFWGYIIHGLVHTEGGTPSPLYRNRDFVKASPPEETLRDLEDSDYAVPNLVFLTEGPKRRRIRTPVVVVRRHSVTRPAWTARATRTRPSRSRRNTTTQRRKNKVTRKQPFQWRSNVLDVPNSTEAKNASTPSSDDGVTTFASTAAVQNRDNALFAEYGSNDTRADSYGNGLLGTHFTVEDTAGNSSVVGNDSAAVNPANSSKEYEDHVALVNGSSPTNPEEGPQNATSPGNVTSDDDYEDGEHNEEDQITFPGTLLEGSGGGEDRAAPNSTSSTSVPVVHVDDTGDRFDPGTSSVVINGTTRRTGRVTKVASIALAANVTREEAVHNGTEEYYYE